MSSMQKMIRQAQQMQAELEAKKSELAEQELTHTRNGVTVVVKGDMSITALTFSDDLMKDAIATDPEMLQDLILVAINGALAEMREQQDQAVGAITGGLMPGLF